MGAGKQLAENAKLKTKWSERHSQLIKMLSPDTVFLASFWLCVAG